ncbi:Flp family type IVb pilin [Candidatus Proelusimicrobium excrementi]|uniref:Flp family type IVb pilin n=1 Tax=Candidatus Proelusimicrobium excrementi TaxID=3416222 RepID=UPI003C87458F|nr:hypothetical protein [Elusimicrobiaceae bacterium]
MMRIIAKMHLAYANAIENVKNKKGQNTIEYMLMLGIIAVAVGVIGLLMKTFLPQLFEDIKGKILGQVGEL